MTTELWRQGTVRACAPEETWARVQPLLAAAGVTRVADITFLDAVAIPVHSAVRPASRTLAISMGKGVSPILSKVSAVMESLELWFAEQPREPAIRTTCWRELGAEIDYCYHELDLATPTLLTDDHPLDWLAGHSLLTDDPVLVPSESVLLDRTVRARWRPPLFEVTSNGLASGNTWHEAVLHGLCEIVERDCLARASANLTERPIATPIADPDVVMLAERLESCANRLNLYDITGPIGVPCIAATVRDDTVPVTFGGFGCHPSPIVAVTRAITEAVQQRLATIAGTRDDLPIDLYTKIHSMSRRPPRTRPGRRLGPLPAELDVPDFAVAIAAIAHRIHEATHRRPFTVTLSDDHDPIAVVKVVAPGLRVHTGHGLRTAGGAQ